MKTILYINETDGSEATLNLDDAAARIRDVRAGKGAVSWFDVEAPTPEDIRVIGDAAGLHELTREDILNQHVREKTREFDNYIYIVGHGLNFNPGHRVLDTINVSMVVMPRMTLTFHAQSIRSLAIVRKRIRDEHGGRLPAADWPVYELLDALTDLYLEQVDRFCEQVDRLDHEVLSHTSSPGMLEALGAARHESSLLLRRLVPKQEFLRQLTSHENPMLSRNVQLYLRDVLDHVIRMQELTGIARETLINAQSNYLAQVSNRMNEVMKILSIVATIMLPLTFLTGLFGMNVPVPGAGSHGMAWFVALVALMLALAGVLGLLFKRKGWF